MLRRERFLPLQLEVAWYLTREMKASGELKDNADTLLFGESREFLEPRSRTQDRTPLVNNVVAARVFTDQHGRVYAYADPLDAEYDVESTSVPWVPVTDRLFVAITNETRQNAGELEPETQTLPQPNDALLLTHVSKPQSMWVTVDTVQEPTARRHRVSSALITLTELVPVGNSGSVTPHAVFERIVDSLNVGHRAGSV